MATNPFAAASAKNTAASNDTDEATTAAPEETTAKKTTAKKTTAAASGGEAFGDPFADPSGPGDGKISDHVGSLILVKPTEFIEGMPTTNGDTDVIRGDFAVLDVPDEEDPNAVTPGTVFEGSLIFQFALVRDLRSVLSGPHPYLLGRLDRGQASGNKSAPYIFTKATEDDRALARQFLEHHGAL